MSNSRGHSFLIVLLFGTAHFFYKSPVTNVTFEILAFEEDVRSIAIHLFQSSVCPSVSVSGSALCLWFEHDFLSMTRRILLCSVCVRRFILLPLNNHFFRVTKIRRVII